jgi:hypothetical protein
MIRRIAVVVTGALAVTGLLTTGAGASTAPPTGTLTCGTTGTVTFKPALTPSTPAPKPTSVKVHKAALSPCDASGVTGGKATINGGDTVFNAKLAPGADCATVAGGTAVLVNPQLIVKLTNTTGSKTATVAVLKPVNITITPSGPSFIIKGDIPQTKAGNKPFGGEHLTSQINIDNISDAIGCALGTNNLSHIDFSAAGGSTLSIAP